MWFMVWKPTWSKLFTSVASSHLFRYFSRLSSLFSLCCAILFLPSLFTPSLALQRRCFSSISNMPPSFQIVYVSPSLVIACRIVAWMEPSADVRIALVGDDGSGKTSIVMSLLEDEWVDSVPQRLDRFVTPWITIFLHLQRLSSWKKLLTFRVIGLRTL